jgi:hypothetical protein
LLKKSGNLRKAVILPAFICTGGGIAYWILCNHLSQTPIPISSLAKHYYASRFFDSVDSSVSFQQYLRWIFENPGRLIYSLLAPYQFIGKYFGLIQIILITLVLGMFLSFYVLAYRKRSADARSSNISKSILIFYIFGFLHMILVVIAVANYSKSTLHYYGWFYGTVCMSTAISFCYLLSLLSSVSLRRLIATIAIALFLYPNFWFIWTQASQEQEIYLNTSRMETAEWIRMNLPKNARIGAWNTGIIGYFSDRTVINLDGMANDKSYLDFLRSGQPIQSYLQKENIQYICDTNTIDLSMRFGEKWNRSKSFRDAIPMKDLILLNGDQKGPIRVYEMKVAN